MSYLYRTGNSRNNIAFTNTANSSTKYLRRTASSRTSIVWTTIPQGSTYNILQRNGTGRNNILWANLTIASPGDPQYSTDISGGQLTYIGGVYAIMDFSVRIYYKANTRRLDIDCTPDLNGNSMYCTHGKGKITTSTSSSSTDRWFNLQIPRDNYVSGTVEVLHKYAKKCTIYNSSDGMWITYKLENPITPEYTITYRTIRWDEITPDDIKSSIAVEDTYNYFNSINGQSINFVFSSVY